MSEEQLSALLAKLKEDEGLRERFKGAADIDAAGAIAKEAGFDVSKADWLRYQAKQTLELSDDDLEILAGGKATGIAASMKKVVGCAPEWSLMDANIGPFSACVV